MIVRQVPNEPTRYRVESRSLECVSCGHKLPHSHYRVADPCPKCGAALDIAFHLVDIARFYPVGECQCEHFRFRLHGKVATKTPEQLGKLSHSEIRELRCTHIEEAREHALNITLRQHAQTANREAHYG